MEPSGQGTKLQDFKVAEIIIQKSATGYWKKANLRTTTDQFLQTANIPFVDYNGPSAGVNTVKTDEDDMRAVLAARLALAQQNDPKSIPADLVLWQCFEYAPANALPAKGKRGTLIAKSGFKVVIRIEKHPTDGYVVVVTRTPFEFTDPVSGNKVQKGVMGMFATAKAIRAVIGLPRKPGGGGGGGSALGPGPPMNEC